MEKNNVKIVKFLNILFSIIFICTLLRIYKIVSIVLTLTFIFVLIFWIRLITKKLNKLDILVIFIVLFSLLNVIFNAYIMQTNISFEYLKKLIMFLCSIIYFSSLMKVQVDFHKYKKFISYINTILSIICIFIYFINFNQVYTFNGILTDYLSFNFTNPNLAALFLTSICIMQTSLAFCEEKKIKKIIYFIISIFLFYFVIKTKARNCLLIIIIFLLINILKIIKKKVKMTNVVNFVISIFPLLFSFLYLNILNNDKITNFFSFLVSTGKSLDSREYIWNFALSNVKMSPIIGAYSQISNGTGLGHMHNTHIDILASYGIVVFLLFCIIIYFILKISNNKLKFLNNSIFLQGFQMFIICGMGEAALFSSSLGLYLYVGNFLILSNSKLNNKMEEK